METREFLCDAYQLISMVGDKLLDSQANNGLDGKDISNLVLLITLAKERLDLTLDEID